MHEKRKPMRRVAELATVGAEIYRLGIGYDQRHAWRGALETELASFVAMFAGASIANLTVGSALGWVVTRDLGPLAEFGEAALHHRRAAAYKADCASWEAQAPAVKQGAWQSKTPSRNQRMLMIRMSDHLGVPLPGDICRGEAAKWIAQHGGNPNFNEEM